MIIYPIDYINNTNEKVYYFIKRLKIKELVRNKFPEKFMSINSS